MDRYRHIYKEARMKKKKKEMENRKQEEKKRKEFSRTELYWIWLDMTSGRDTMKRESKGKQRELMN